MHSGKWFDRASIEEALIDVPGRTVSESDKVESGVAKFLERWFRIGVRRSSSSMRGNARAVIWWHSYSKYHMDVHQASLTQINHTSRPLSKFATNAASTILICSLAGT